MLALLPFASQAVCAATATKKVVDLFTEFQDIPEEGYFLWKLLDTISPPFNLCREYQKREETLAAVDPAVNLTRFAIMKCEQCLAKDEDEDERPNSEEGWVAWLSRSKKGHSRFVTQYMGA